MTKDAYLAKIQELEAEIASLTAQLIVSKQSKATEIHTHHHYPIRPAAPVTSPYPYRPYWSVIPQTSWMASSSNTMMGEKIS